MRGSQFHTAKNQFMGPFYCFFNCLEVDEMKINIIISSSCDNYRRVSLTDWFRVHIVTRTWLTPQNLASVALRFLQIFQKNWSYIPFFCKNIQFLYNCPSTFRDIIAMKNMNIFCLRILIQNVQFALGIVRIVSVSWELMWILFDCISWVS